MKNKPSILWHSEFLCKTGFAKVSNSLVDKLRHSFDITVIDWTKKFKQNGGILPTISDHPDYEGVKLIGRLTDKDQYADIMMQALDLDQFDIIFIINDVWIINQLCALLKHRNYKGKVVCYFPVDAMYHDPDWYSNLDIASTVVTYTEFAKKEVLRACPSLSSRLQIIPHGTDTKIFYPLPGSKYQIRESLFGTSLFNDSFIALNANRNQPRKRLDITMEGFSLFAQDKTDVFLYMHCSNIDSSMDILKLAKRYNIVNKLIQSKNAGITGIPDHQLNVIYNACDVGVNTSIGEGWGLTNTEMAAVGKPQIVPDHSACKELFSDFGYLIGCQANYTQDHIMTVGKLPSPSSLAYQLDRLYRKEHSTLTDPHLKKFTGSKYLWQNIAMQWEAIFTT